MRQAPAIAAAACLPPSRRPPPATRSLLFAGSYSRTHACPLSSRSRRDLAGVPFERMCFFDDQQGNVDDVAELGVHAFLTPEGVTKEIFAKGLRAARGGSSSML